MCAYIFTCVLYVPCLVSLIDVSFTKSNNNKNNNNNNNNGNLARPTSAEPMAFTKTTLHKREYNNHNNIHNKHNQKWY